MASSAGFASWESAAAFAGYACFAITVVRARFKSPRLLSTRRIFESKHFSDRQILEQLIDNRFQTRLEEHNWDLLLSKGPCFGTLAQAIIAGKTLEEALAAQHGVLAPEVLALLLRRLKVLAAAMCEIAESYLARNLPKPAEGGKGSKKNKEYKTPPNIVLTSAKGRLYRPVKFIARGSAGAIYSAVRVEGADAKFQNIVGSFSGNGKAPSKTMARFIKAVNSQLERQLVLKRIEPTQKSSAENEYRIASLLAKRDLKSRCVAYLDRADESADHLWLVLRRINPSPFGIDLREYIEGQFFQTNSDRFQGYAQAIVLQLLDGLDYISSCGVCMRDVKPDNVLVEYQTMPGGEERVCARWSDFGLSVDLGKQLDAHGVRNPLVLATANGADPSDAALQESLTGFWYDTQKLVPKPKWEHRRPPERCFQDPTRIFTSSYDLYMVGIIFLSMAIGVDIPHIDRAQVKAEFEQRTGVPLAKDYLSSFELGEFARRHADLLVEHFKAAFGPAFGEILLREVQLMLALDPRERPRPAECRSRLVSVAMPEATQSCESPSPSTPSPQP